MHTRRAFLAAALVAPVVVRALRPPGPYDALRKHLMRLPEQLRQLAEDFQKLKAAGMDCQLALERMRPTLEEYERLRKGAPPYPPSLPGYRA